MRDIHSFMARRWVVTGRRVILGLCLVASLSCRADIRLPKSSVDAEQDGSGLVWTLARPFRMFSFDGSRWRQVRIPFSPDVKPSPSNFAEWRMVRWRHSGRAIHQIASLSPSILTANPSSPRNFRARLRRADRCCPIRRTASGLRNKARTLCGSMRMAGDEWIRDIAADMQGRIWILSAYGTQGFIL